MPNIETEDEMMRATDTKRELAPGEKGIDDKEAEVF